MIQSILLDILQQYCDSKITMNQMTDLVRENGLIPCGYKNVKNVRTLSAREKTNYNVISVTI